MLRRFSLRSFLIAVMTVIVITVFLISFFATLVRSTFGFGESLVAVPLFSLVMPVNAAVPLSVLISVLVALVVVVQDHRAIELKSAGGLILWALPGIPLGVVLLTYGNEVLLKTGLGLLLILYAAYALQRKKVYAMRYPKAWVAVCGFLSGMLGGAFGINGPPLAVYGKLRNWDAQKFRATLQAYFLPASLLGLLGYLIKGLISQQVLLYFAIALPAAIPAIFIGRYLNRHLKGQAFYQAVYWGLLAIGLLLITLR